MPYDGSPAAGQVPAGWRKKMPHAHLSLDGQSLMGCDAGEAERVFRALGGTGRMPVREATAEGPEAVACRVSA